jgi:D-arabinose 1-dehydrogenase-like Zn-dependent alcohol dehydrogenase
MCVPPSEIFDKNSGYSCGPVHLSRCEGYGPTCRGHRCCPEKLALAKEVGAAIAVDASSPQAIDEVLRATGGGAHGVLVTAPSPKAFSQAFKLARRKVTVALVGLSPGDFPTPIFEVVLKRITVRG